MKTFWKAGPETSFAKRAAPGGLNSGFTLTELLVVLATLGMLAAVALPVLAGTQPRSKAFQCLNNLRQLALAGTLYAGENNERLVINSDVHVTGSYLYNSLPSWATGSADWSSSSSNTNAAYVATDKYSLLAKYLAHSAYVFACPAENYVSPPQRALGWDHRIRTVTMNAAIGDGAKYQEPSPFGWTQWYVAKKSTDFKSPGPGQVWVFVDEHPDSIDDGLMYVSPYPTSRLIELPGNQHEGSAGITFADGHVELHKWAGAVLPNRPVAYQTAQNIACALSDVDMVWLSQHTPSSP